MTLPTASTARRAATVAPIHDLLAERWSPRSFDAAATVSDEAVASMLEAARWSPSAANFQPRRFVVARRGSAAFDSISAALSEGNQPWAPAASLYVVAIALTDAPEGQSFRWSEYDAGQAMAYLTVQAHELGLHVHPMGGFDADALRTAFALPASAVPVTVSAIGVVAPAEQLPERYRSREGAERTRLPLSDLVLVNE